MRREQLGAEPSTFTTDRLLFCTTCELASAGSGGATCRARVGARSPNTSGKPLVSTVSRNAVDRSCALSGSTWSTTVSSALLRTEEASHGTEEEPSGTATSQATSMTAMTEMNAPPTSSTFRPAGPVMAARRLEPSQPASACPSTARPKIATRETSTRVPLAVNCWAISGPTWRPSSAPRKKPENDRAPMTKP